MMNESDKEYMEKMFKLFEGEFQKVGLNGEVFSTIIREFGRVASVANHEQIHFLLNLVESLHHTLSVQHVLIANEDQTHGGQENDTLGD